MSIGQISIHSTPAKLEFQSTRPTIEMEQQQVQIQIETELPRVIIDQTECFNTAGLKNNTALMESKVSEAKQNILNYIETTVGDGKLFGAIEEKEDARDKVKQIAVRDMFREHTLTIVPMPTARPQIEVTGSLKIDFTPRDLGAMNGVTYYVNLGKLQGNYIPGSIQVDYKV